MNPRNNAQQVELLNVPHYRQGQFDGLCLYYAGAMMLASLYPRYSWNFGELVRKPGMRNKAHDPIFRHYAGEYREEKPGSDDRYVLARWFFEGAHVTELSNTLNNCIKQSGETTRFHAREKKTNKATFFAIAESIDVGLPVLLGWNTKDYGNHAVLVIGYWHGKDDWLLFNDPSGDTQISWQVLGRAAKGKLEVLKCRPKTHAGPRSLSDLPHDIE